MWKDRIIFEMFSILKVIFFNDHLNFTSISMKHFIEYVMDFREVFSTFPEKKLPPRISPLICGHLMWRYNLLSRFYAIVGFEVIYIFHKFTLMISSHIFRNNFLPFFLFEITEVSNWSVGLNFLVIIFQELICITSK